MEAKRRIHKFNFDKPFMQSGAKTHVALVDKAANLTEVLVMKAKSSYETVTHTSETYDDNGDFERVEVSTSVSDYGGEYVTVTDRVYHVKEERIKIR